MKILFVKDVGGVGQRGVVKDISDGYALNYLIPNGMAIQATPEKVKEHDARAKKEAAAKEAHDSEIHTAIKGLEGAVVTIEAKATEKGGLFKAITAADIFMDIK